MEAPAPGARVLIRDEEWLVRSACQCDQGGYELECLGVSDTVRHRDARFLTAIDEVKLLDPCDTELVADDSPAWIGSRLYLEARLRQTVPTEAALGQRIYRHKVTLSRVGIDIRGRGRKLRVNYRTTDEIRKWAVARLANCAIDDLDGQPDSLVGYLSLVHGEAPEIVVSASRAEEQSRIEEALRQLDADGLPSRNVCLVVRTNEEAAEYAQWLQSTGRAVLKLDRNTQDDDSRPGIRVATMHRVKGLEFDAVIVAGYRSPEYYAEIYGAEADAGVLLDNLTSERCLLHVAATRAKRYLMVSQMGQLDQ